MAEHADNQASCEQKDTLGVRRRIGVRLRARRYELNMEQGELASITGISQASISKYESATAAMRAEDIPRLAQALKVTPAYFYDEFPSSPDELGVDWGRVENWLLLHFRSLPPTERLALAHTIFMTVVSNDMSAEQWTGADKEP